MELGIPPKKEEEEMEKKKNEHGLGPGSGDPVFMKSNVPTAAALYKYRCAQSQWYFGGACIIAAIKIKLIMGGLLLNPGLNHRGM